jgi:hypothetical protein
MHDLDPGFLPQQLAGEVMRRADSGGAILQLARIGFGIGDQLRHRIDGQIDVDRETDDVRARVGDRREVFDRIERRVFVEKDVAGHDRVGADHQRVTVGRCARDVPGGDIAAHTRPVVDDDGLAPGGVEPLGHGAREQIAGRTRRIADHDRDRPRRIILCDCRRGSARAMMRTDDAMGMFSLVRLIAWFRALSARTSNWAANTTG